MRFFRRQEVGQEQAKPDYYMMYAKEMVRLAVERAERQEEAPPPKGQGQ